jgi:hypothetical protein
MGNMKIDIVMKATGSPKPRSMTPALAARPNGRTYLARRAAK